MTTVVVAIATTTVTTMPLTGSELTEKQDTADPDKLANCEQQAGALPAPISYTCRLVASSEVDSRSPLPAPHEPLPVLGGGPHLT